jgi:hypothetical protein
MAAIEPGSSAVIIGRMLSPAFMVNAAALLLLSLHNKFSTLSARVRALNAERRGLQARAAHADQERLANLSLQIKRLAYRLRCVRRAIMFHYTAIALFLFTSFLIAINTFVQSRLLVVTDIGVFTAGMLSIFLGTMSHLRDVGTGFDAIRLETPDAFE